MILSQNVLFIIYHFLFLGVGGDHHLIQLKKMNNLESYPPFLRHLSHHQPRNHELDHGDLTQDPDPLPVIDLQCLNHDKNKLEEACKIWGLFRLVNHGVPLTLLSQLQHQAKQLFSLPFESKQASCSGTPVTYFWGTPALTPSGAALSRLG